MNDRNDEVMFPRLRATAKSGGTNVVGILGRLWYKYTSTGVNVRPGRILRDGLRQ